MGTKKSLLMPLLGDPKAPYRGVTGRRILSGLQDILPRLTKRHYIFIYNNAPTFISHIIQDWLCLWARERGLEIADWPPYSPNLNPIEHMWPHLKDNIVAAHPELEDMPKNDTIKELLIEAAIEAWDAIEDRLYKTLAHLMRDRCEAIYNADGWYTKY